MLRFVILRHETPVGHPRASHWDLMLEDGPRLRTWSLSDLPQFNRRLTVDALADHRFAYLDIEGPIAGGRGHVTRWDGGELEWIVKDADRFVAQLRGTRLRARIQLTLDPATQRWFLDAWSLDEAARD
jgi:hypothetical protein